MQFSFVRYPPVMKDEKLHLKVYYFFSREAQICFTSLEKLLHLRMMFDVRFMFAAHFAQHIPQKRRF